MQVAPLPGLLPFGCAVTGLRLSDGPLTDAQFAALAAAFHAHGVVVLRDRELTDRELSTPFFACDFDVFI